MKLPKSILYLLIASAIAYYSCNSTKEMASENPITNEITNPCSENGNSDSNYFRASANSTSSNINLAREKALAEAKTQIAKQIINTTSLIANKYAEEYKIADKQAFAKKMEQAANQTSDIVLKGILPTCEKYSETNGRYTAYVSTEISKQLVATELTKQTSNLIPDINVEIIKRITDE